MGRWSNRRAARRAHNQGNYLGDYYGQADQTGTTSPYQVQIPPESDAGQPKRPSRRFGQPRAGRYRFPDWVLQTERLDPAQAGRVAREHRRRSAGWPSASQAGTATSEPRRRFTSRPRVAPGATANATTESQSTGRSARSGSRAAVAPRKSRQRRLIAVVSAAAGIVAIGVAIAVVPRGPDVASRDHPEFATVWHTEFEELDADLPGAPALTAIDSADRGGNRREMITTESTWVLVAEQGDVRALIALDPADGSQVWRHDLPDVMCSHRTGEQDTLFCLAAHTPGGQDWSGYVFDAATGAELMSWPAPITGAWAVSLTDAGLAVLAESQPHTYDHLVLLDSQDGTEIWAADLSVIDDEFLFRTHDIDDVEQTYLPNVSWSGQDEQIMLSSGTTVIFFAGGSGEFWVQDCYPTVLTGEILGCSSFPESTMYDASGEPLWTSDQVDLARPSYRGEHVLVNVADQWLHHTDWDSGYIGAAVQEVGYSPIATGSSAHPFLIDDDDLVSLAPDGSHVHWTQRVRGMNSITDVWVLDDVAVVAGDSALALDLATGEELWQRSYIGDMYLVGLDPVLIGYREVSLLQVP